MLEVVTGKIYRPQWTYWKRDGSFDTTSPFSEPPEFNLKEFQNNLQYPEEALDAGIEQEIQLIIFIGLSGRVDRIDVIGTPSALLVRAAAEAALLTEFSPAKTEDGTAVRASLILPVRFRLR